MDSVLSAGLRLNGFSVADVWPFSSNKEVKTPQEAFRPHKRFNLTLSHDYWKTLDKKDLIARSMRSAIAAEVVMSHGERHVSSNAKFYRDGDDLWIAFSCSEEDDPSEFTLGDCTIITFWTDTSVWIGFEGGHIAICFGA